MKLMLLVLVFVLPGCAMFGGLEGKCFNSGPVTGIVMDEEDGKCTVAVYHTAFNLPGVGSGQCKDLQALIDSKAATIIECEEGHKRLVEMAREVQSKK